MSAQPTGELFSHLDRRETGPASQQNIVDALRDPADTTNPDHQIASGPAAQRLIDTPGAGAGHS
jgi:hypothetical protein